MGLLKNVTATPPDTHDVHLVGGNAITAAEVFLAVQNTEGWEGCRLR